MNGGQQRRLAAEAPAGPAPPRAAVRSLACFAGAKRAAKIHRELNKRIEQGGDAILDEVVVKVNAKHKAQVHDPRRTLAGTLTPALTWGLFGLLAGGLKSLAVWAVVGAICGGLYAYYSEHLRDQERAQAHRPPAAGRFIGPLRLRARGRPAADPVLRRLLRAHDGERRGRSRRTCRRRSTAAPLTGGELGRPGRAAATGPQPGAVLNMLLVRSPASTPRGRRWPSPDPRSTKTGRSRRSSCSSRRTSTAGGGSSPQDGNRRLCEERHPRLGAVRRRRGG